jgi:hypothetical protein
MVKVGRRKSLLLSFSCRSVRWTLGDYFDPLSVMRSMGEGAHHREVEVNGVIYGGGWRVVWGSEI